MKNIVYLLSILTLLLQSTLLAKDTMPITTINFVEEGKWPPFTPNKYGYTQEGLSYILMKEIFSRLNIEVNLELVPQRRMLKYLEYGRKDASTIISKNKSRMEYINFSDSIIQKKGFIYYSKRNTFDWEKYEDLKGLKIGVVAGHNLGHEFIEATKKYNLDINISANAEENFNKLAHNKIDVLLSTEATANYFLNDITYGNRITHAAKQYYSKYYYIGFSKKSKAKILIPKVNKVINQMKKDGSLKRILAKYSMSF